MTAAFKGTNASITKPFIPGPGTCLDHPVKNYIRLIRAFGIFKERTKHPHRLVPAGADGLRSEKIKAAAWGWNGSGPFPREALIYSIENKSVHTLM
ncbi:MAG: hypothetical protein LBQ55_05180 [Treponema sp.]|nr:hypothetical protein [Treponema sp.]